MLIVRIFNRIFEPTSSIRALSAVTIIMVVALLGVGCQQSNQNGGASNAETYAQAQEAASQESPSSIHGQSQNISKAQKNTLSGYICINEIDCSQMGPLAATSEKEARWLQSHGYPTQQYLNELNLYSTDQLKRAAQNGSMPAQVIYGERIALNEDFRQGVQLVAKAAQEGSIYAYYGLSRIYAAKGKRQDMIDAAAYLRLAHMLGDYRSTDQVAQNFGNFGPADSYIIDKRAASLYSTFAKNRVPSPRPIADSR